MMFNSIKGVAPRLFTNTTTRLPAVTPLSATSLSISCAVIASAGTSGLRRIPRSP